MTASGEITAADLLKCTVTHVLIETVKFFFSITPHLLEKQVSGT